MPTTTFHIPSLTSQEAADVVLFDLQDLPCIHVADVNLANRTAWADHSTMITPDEIAESLAEVGHPCDRWSD